MESIGCQYSEVADYSIYENEWMKERKRGACFFLRNSIKLVSSLSWKWKWKKRSRQDGEWDCWGNAVLHVHCCYNSYTELLFEAAANYTSSNSSKREKEGCFHLKWVITPLNTYNQCLSSLLGSYGITFGILGQNHAFFFNLVITSFLKLFYRIRKLLIFIGVMSPVFITVIHSFFEIY